MEKQELLDLCEELLEISDYSKFFEVAPWSNENVIVFVHKDKDGKQSSNGEVSIDITEEDKIKFKIDVPTWIPREDMVSHHKLNLYCDLTYDNYTRWEDRYGNLWKSPYAKFIFIINQIWKERSHE